MRGLWVTEYTDFDKLTVEEIPRLALESKQIRLRIHAAGISFSANLVVTGKYQRKPPLPFTPGTECAGVVIECGPDVTRFKAGDRICAALDWGANAILDPVGGDVFDQSLRCIALEGRIAPVGFTAGRAPQIPANIVLVKNITVCGLNFGTYYGWSPNDVRYEMEGRVRAILDRFYQWANDDMIHPHVCATFPLDDSKEAMAMVTSRKSIGRVALVMKEGE